MTAEATELELVGIELEAAQPSGAAVGRLDEASEVAAALLGKRVLVGALDACGQCEVCRRGGAPVCPHATRRDPVGSRTRHIRAATRWLVPLGDGLDLPVPAAAAVPGDVTIAYTLYARTGLSPREPVVIAGENAVTRFLVEILLAKGITPTVLVEREDAAWRDWLLAKEAQVVSADDSARAAAIMAAIAAQGQGARPWRIMATEPAKLREAAALAGPRATLTVLAQGAVPGLSGEVLAREVTLIGVAGPHPDLVVEAAAMCVKGEIDLAGGVVIDGADAAHDPTRARVLAMPP